MLLSLENFPIQMTKRKISRASQFYLGTMMANYWLERVQFEYMTFTANNTKRTFEQIADDLYRAFSEKRLFAVDSGSYRTTLERLICG